MSDLKKIYLLISRILITLFGLFLLSLFADLNDIYVVEFIYIELTVPWEENCEEAHERKKNHYETLRADCVEKG